MRILVSTVMVTAALHSTAAGQTNAVQASRQLTPSEMGTAAVLSFEGRNGVAFSDLISHELLQRGVPLVERTRLAAVLRERDLTLDDLAAGRVDSSVLIEAARIDTLIFGSVTPITVYVSGADSGRVSVASLRLVDVRSGKILSSVSFNSNTEVLLKGKTYGTAATMMVAALIRNADRRMR
ncbi:MAG: hypothetical protein A3I61_19365 [Acidobacteria bacterium RIFCSPLOWO2_02_FULL_68_18]|nr:MAG: hypothetical protein A3I61_19365 [Acidobacteria bacterium RIFCSPLOWO2_02_FULL_68_18]OFW49726.1 MAG: hypothetical protein A3G77_06475 [Acidobacteria bacterium RIFCSPLOWO2_12_FULL_68_19]